MKAKTKNSSGNVEIVLGISILLVVIVVVVNSVLSNNDNSIYNKYKDLADNFAEEVSKYANEEENEYGLTYYLSDVYSKINKLKDYNQECNIYDSYVEIKKTMKVRLSCDNYLIEGDYNKNYYLYEIGKWTKDNTLEETTFLYNYQKDNKEVLKDYYLEKEFINEYNKKENTSFDNINSIYEDAKEKNLEIVSDIYYREKKLIKEL